MKRILKKSLAFILVLTMVFGAAPLAGLVGLELPEFNLFGTKAEATTYSGTCGNNLIWTLGDETGILEINGTGAMTNYSHPSYVPWYTYRSSIETIIIGNGVTSIGDFAFCECDGLTSVTIPDSVTSIGNYAFNYCDWLTSITIGNSVTSIGDGAFSGCHELTSVTIPNSVTSIGYGAFHSCDELTSVTIPDSVTSIGDYAFEDCTGLTSVTIGNGVTSIGDHAFYDCTELTYITIGNGVTSIGDEAFYNCTGLTSVTIGNSVMSIGDFAFEDCTGLTSVTIPDSVTSIGDGAFYNCTGLKSVTIPNSVTSIGYGAFYECAKLKSVTIPDSVTSIGYGAFCDCTSITVDVNNPNYSSDKYGVLFNKDKTELIQYPIGNTRTEYTIPNSVTSIGDFAFYECDGLTSVTIPDSVTSIGDSAFYNCISLADVYYAGTEDEWKAISIGIDNECFTNATIHYNAKTTPTIKSSKYAIIVNDIYGNPIAGAKVTWNSDSDLTDKEGMAVFNRFTIGQPSITVEKTGYMTYSNANMNYSKSSKGYEYITLYADTEGNRLKLKSAKYSSDDSDGFFGDLLRTTKRVSLKKIPEFTISCVANDSDYAVKYELYQNDILITESTDGVFKNLSASGFKKGGGVEVRVYSDNTNYVITPINLILEKEKSNNESGFSIGKDIEITVDDDIPFIGGSTLKTSFPVFPVDISCNENEEGESTISVAINADIYGAEKDENSGKWTKEEKEEFKKKQESKIKDIKKALSTMESWYLRSTNPNDKELKEIKNLCEDNSKSDLPGLDSVSVSFLGYGEGVLNSDSKFSKITINAYIIVEATVVDSTYQSFAALGPVVIPIVFNITVTGEAKAGGEFSYSFDTSTFSGDFKLMLSAGVNMFGGVGIGKAIGVGGYGSATLDSEIQLVGTTNSTGLNSVDLTGEAGFKAYFAIWSYEKPWAYRTWNIYTRNKNPKKTAALKTASIVSDDNSIYDINSYSLQNLSYLKGESGWLGANQSGSGMLHTSSVSNSITEIMPLITQTYRDSRPMIVSAGDTMVMVYTGSDQSRTVYNHTRVMYSVYDKATNSWSEPKQLDNNNTLDMTPYLYSDGTNIYVVYSDATKVFDESDSIETVIASQNISVSEFNFESNGFDNPTVLVPSDGKYNSVPIIGTADGVPTVIYQCNASNSVFGTTSDNSIIKVTLNGEKETVASNLNSIVGYAVGSKGVAYIIDSDNVLSTCDDRLLYLNGDFIEAGVVSNPQFSSNGKLYWYSNGTVKEYDNGINEIYPEGIAGFTDSFKVLDNKIVYLTATSENTSNIMQLNFENGSWSQPVLLVNQDKIIDTFSATEFGGEIVSVMTRRNVTITESSVDDECEIAWTAIKDKHDISVNYVDYEHDDVKPNSSLAITAGILNSGTTDIKKLNVEITSSTGEVVYSQNQDVSIKPAEDFELTATVPIGETVSLDEYSVKVTEVGIDDYDETDNLYKVKIGYSQFFVNSETLIGGDNRSLMVTIRNDGYTASGGTLNVYNSFNNEEPVVSYGISKISNGEQKLCRIDVTEEMLGGKSGKLYLEFEPDVEQFNAFDNKTEAYIELCSHENVGDWVIETEATCTQPGEKVKRCVDCSVAMESEEITPHGHGETEAVIITATCTESGRTYEACSICGEALSDITETNPIGHKEGQWKVLAEPTIYLEGYEILCCENCNVVLDERIIPKKVFSKVTWIVDGQEKVQTYISGDLISKPENPQMDGYRFVGWTPEVPDTMPDYDLTFTAVFEKIEAPNDGKTVVSIKHPSTTTINYGESLTLYATASNLPEGGKIKWRIVEGTGVSIEPSRSGMYCIVTSESTGNVVIEAYAVDSHGNIITDESGNICSDKEGVHSEDNLWLRIVYFFRKLFGINKVYSQFFKVIF